MFCLVLSGSIDDSAAALGSDAAAPYPNQHLWYCYHAESHEIFKGIRATLSRSVLEDDGKGRRKLLVGHRALTKFLWVSVTFDTGAHKYADALHMLGGGTPPPAQTEAKTWPDPLPHIWEAETCADPVARSRQVAACIPAWFSGVRS